MEIGYKVFDRRDKKMYSPVIRYTGGVEYLIDVWNTPKDGWGPMCILPTLELAKDFIKMYGDMAMGEAEVWEVEYEPSKETSVWQRYVDGSKDDTEKHVLFGGTVLADGIKLTAMKYKEK